MRAIINCLAPCLRHRFEQLLDEPWDVIQIEHSYSFQPFEKALQARGLPYMLSEHTLESVMGGARHDRLPLWLRPLNAFDRWRYRRWEQRVLRQPTEVVAVSSHDAELIAQISGRPVNVVVSGVDCDFYQQVQPSLHSQRLLFVGNFEYGSNLEAIEWALEEIMPQVWMSNPAVRLAIARQLEAALERPTHRMDRLSPRPARAAAPLGAVLRPPALCRGFQGQGARSDGCRAAGDHHQQGCFRAGREQR